jgi:ferric-dicitrate binding protein FerR (iron transport regulator)
VIVRVFAGESTAAEEAELAQWLAAGSGRPERLEQLRWVWEESGAHVTTAHEGWDTAGLQHRILRALEPTVVTLHEKSRRSRLSVAAAVLLAIGLATAGAWIAKHRTNSMRVVAAPLNEIGTKRGQRAALQLSDGTRITLGVDSRLRYPESFAAGRTREVYLDGEAYFEVAHDAARPFLVHSKNTVTRVLGTRFGVRAYAGEQGVRVVVAEGRVALAGTHDTSNKIFLTRGDLGELSEEHRPTVRHDVDVARYLSWVNGRLTFADTPLREVLQQLSRWYDVDVRLGDPSLANKPYTMSLHGGEVPEYLFQVIAAAVGARVERRGKAYVFLRIPPTVR